jgi:hypothetical protein
LHAQHAREGLALGQLALYLLLWGPPAWRRAVSVIEAGDGAAAGPLTAAQP